MFLVITQTRAILIWLLINKYILGTNGRNTDHDSQLSTSVKVSAIICMVVFFVVVVAFLIFCWLIQWKCKLPNYIVNLETSSIDDDENEMTHHNSRRASVFTVEGSNGDPPPSYEAGLRSETPPPSFDALFPTPSDMSSEISSHSSNSSSKNNDS